MFRLTDDIYLTQDDIRQVQLAKGAIYAGIFLMAKQLGLEIQDINKVLLAGAFGNYLNPASACRIGLLPEELLDRIVPIGKKMTAWIIKAKEMGFDAAISLNPQMLESREDVRSMCAADKCGAYNKNWTCPPTCGTIEECQERMQSYENGILLQSIGHMAKAIDSKRYRETEQRHMQNFYAFAEEVRKEFPDALCLGTGGCRVCKQCAFLEPCRFPEKAMSSMEGYGFFVTQVCRDTGIPYHYGDRTITYTACVLF